MTARISRRKFAQILSTSGLAGTALVEKMFGEIQDSGSISCDSLRAFVNSAGLKVSDEQMVPVQASLERALDGMKRIRDRNLPHSLEPAVTFRVRR